MTGRQKETRFLKTLLMSHDSAECHVLKERIKLAEQDEKCIRSAVYLVSILGLLSFSGLGYTAVLVPEFAQFHSHLATKFFCALGLGSVIGVSIFLVFWLRYRMATDRIYDECRLFVHSMVEAKSQSSASPADVVTVSQTGSKLYKIETHKSQDDTELLQRAS